MRQIPSHSVNDWRQVLNGDGRKLGISVDRSDGKQERVKSLKCNSELLKLPLVGHRVRTFGNSNSFDHRSAHVRARAPQTVLEPKRWSAVEPAPRGRYVVSPVDREESWKCALNKIHRIGRAGRGGKAQRCAAHRAFDRRGVKSKPSLQIEVGPIRLSRRMRNILAVVDEVRTKTSVVGQLEQVTLLSQVHPSRMPESLRFRAADSTNEHWI